jgi:hypothetical protein
MWEAPVENLTLLGGYDADFETRDPWQNLAQLHWDKASKFPKNPKVTAGARAKDLPVSFAATK